MSPQPSKASSEHRPVRPLSEPEVAVTILDEILGYPDLRSFREAVRHRSPDLQMEDRHARARILANEIPPDSLRRLLSRLGGHSAGGGGSAFTTFPETDSITWTERLLTSLFTVSLLDPEREPDALLDAICDEVLHLSGWRGVRLWVADHESLTLTALRDCRVRPLIDGRPAPHGAIIREQMQVTNELTKSPDEPPTHLEGWVYWRAQTAVVKSSDSPILKELSRKVPKGSYDGKTTIFHPLIANLRGPVPSLQPIAILGTACVSGEEEAAQAWINPAAPFLDVTAEILNRWVRYNLGRRHAQADLRTLSNRELEMLTCIGDGLSTERTATKLGISVQTVKTHRRRLREKLGIRNEAELVKLAIQTGLTGSA